MTRLPAFFCGIIVCLAAGTAVSAQEVHTCNGLPATIVGTDNADALLGTPGDDVIVALGGNDIVTGFGGNDTICAGDGDDVITGDGGADALFGEAGEDVLDGGADSDVLDGGADDDVCNGTAGIDTFISCEQGAPVSSSSVSSQLSSSASSASSASSESSASSASSSSSSSSSLSSSSSSSSSSSPSSTPPSSSPNDQETGNDDERTLVTPQGGNGSRRGHQTNIIDGAMRYLAAMHLGNTKELSGIPPGAFGGRRTPLNENEESFLCSIKRMLPDAPDAGLLQWALMRIASIVPRDHALLRTLLIEEDLCPKPRPVARMSLVRTVVLAMDAEGVPVSTNATWNACIRGYVTLEQIRANPDRDQDGRARDCGWYHTGSLWRHPDAGIEFQWDREQGTAVAPEGYVFEQPTPLLSVR